MTFSKSKRTSQHFVFSYGSLTSKFNSLPKYSALLKGVFELERDDMFPELRKGSRGQIKTIMGDVLILNDKQLSVADQYESDLYTRELFDVSVDELGDIQAWVYIAV